MKLAAVAVLALAVLASPGSASGPRAVSGGSPYGTCSNGTQQGAEGSPALARPEDPVVVWQQDVDHGEGGEIVTAAAGLGSTAGALSGGACGPEGRPGDVVSPASLATAPDGVVWSAAVVNGGGVAQVRVAHLAPGGSWQSEVVAEQPAALPNLQFLPATVAVAPTTPPTVHVAYVRNEFPAGTLAFHRSHVVGSGVWSPEHLISVGPTPVAYDFAEQLVSLGERELVAVSSEVEQGALLTLLPDYLTYGDLTQAPVMHRVRRSIDGGVTWSPPTLALRLTNGGVRDRDVPGTALRSLVRPSVAVGPDGVLHIAGESVSPDGTSAEVLVASPCEAGWCTTTAATVPGLAIAASVAVDQTGELAVSWLDLSGDVRGDRELDAQWHWSSVGPKGWSEPRAFTREFDLRTLAPAYVGDQGALLGHRRGFWAAPVVGTRLDANPSDVLLVRLG